MKRQTLPQADPIATERIAVILMMRFDMLFREVIGWDRMTLSLGIDNARVIVVKNRASSGTDSRT